MGSEMFIRDRSKYDAKLVEWLVENHLLMSKTSQREDLEDPDVITDFSKKIGDQTHLDYLYLIEGEDQRLIHSLV